MNMSQTDVCDLCNAEVGEDLEHVFFDCPSTTKSVWSSLVYSILSLMKASVLFSFAELLPAAKIQFLIGDIGYLFSSDVGYFYDSLWNFF